jgi:hypothetical protein
MRWQPGLKHSWLGVVTAVHSAHLLHCSFHVLLCCPDRWLVNWCPGGVPAKVLNVWWIKVRMSAQMVSPTGQQFRCTSGGRQKSCTITAQTTSQDSAAKQQCLPWLYADHRNSQRRCAGVGKGRSCVVALFVGRHSWAQHCNAVYLHPLLNVKALLSQCCCVLQMLAKACTMLSRAQLIVSRVSSSTCVLVQLCLHACAHTL